MKKNFSILLATLILILSFCFLVGCNTTKKDITIYAPDGAPALALANLLSEDTQEDGVSYQIVNASSINSYVTYTDMEKNADLCILPVNAAAKALGNGENYQMLGTVTHGNLFLLSKNHTETITTENISTLVGKTVGIINLDNVPGLTFKAILSDNQIEYSTIQNDGTIDNNKVNLKNVSAAEVLPTSPIDYFVVPEPAASLKKKAANFSFVGNLQTLYSAENNGYPQAVLVAKKSLINSQKSWIDNFLQKIQENKQWLTTAETQTILTAINSHLPSGSDPSLNEKNTNSDVIKNCGINYTSAKECKDEVNSYLQKINYTLPVDAFYYGL